jgi:hypothetical protein
MTEQELLRNIEELCDELGLFWHHCNDSRHCSGHKGIPDLIIAGQGGLVLAELKSESGESSAHQDLWGWTLTRAWRAMNAQAHPSGWVLWRPLHLADGTIRAALEGIAKPCVF